ncbi:Toprim domain-containing protein [Pontibacter ummariensis]|uniref:Toprim-like n=1 Tax=Pontibacter ummariensis TaxID=1610492 RepID=A0A239DVN7_9BACT|nr:DnaB-like helicase C-terminal domain-containing protein [Pontibacter ummariensis]PRY13737.1 Toprim domain-containing protein [Pontibacter ummariensis]SNS36387.1 Toprim-like [Pontibacter ummariensis]
MSDVTSWINDELYPSLYDHVSLAFPEHRFEQYRYGWRSQAYLFGEPHRDRKDKTVISKKVPGRIMEHGGDSLTLVDYVIKRDNSTLVEALRKLASVAGIEMPGGNEYDEDAFKKYRQRAAVLEDANSYFAFCLVNSPAAVRYREYLDKRGYTADEVKQMELGYIPSLQKLYNHLQGDKKHQLSDIEDAFGVMQASIRPETRIGTTHQLTLPYRSGGSIKGFKFRALDEQVKPKYLNNPGLDKLGGFFNISSLKGDKDLVVVEGELDSLHATVKTIDNVVATGGSSINPEQVQDAKRKGARAITLCFDYEEDAKKQDEIARKIMRALDVLDQEEALKVYVATLPDLGNGKTDPDRLLKEAGVEALREVIRSASPSYEYRLQSIMAKYGAVEEEKGTLEAKDIDNLLDEVVAAAVKIKRPVERDIYIRLFITHGGISHYGITTESMAATVDRLQYKEDRAKQEQEFKKLLEDVKGLQGKGDVNKALDLLSRRSTEIKAKGREVEFSSLLLPVKEADITQRQRSKPDSLATGYSIGGEDLLLPSGAISIFAAPTSHGKTTVLVNVALNVVEAYPNKEFHIFSYEEDADSILINALNTYIGRPVADNNRKRIKDFYTSGDERYFTPGNASLFHSARQRFFNELVTPRRLNVHYSGYDSDTLLQAITYLHKTTNIGGVFIDYMQLLRKGTGFKFPSRQEELKQICLDLKDLSVETGLPIILGAQFNREVTSQLKIHPTKISEAGDIERVANLIVGFWNNNFKPIATDAELREINSKGCDSRDTIYTTVLKNRGGEVGTEDLWSFHGNSGKISNSHASYSEVYTM